MADFRQFYGIDLPVDDDGDMDDLPRMALLWGALPRESRVARRVEPSLEWSATDYLLRAIEYDARTILWTRTKDGQKGRNAPKPMDTPGERHERHRRAEAALSARSEIDSILGIT